MSVSTKFAKVIIGLSQVIGNVYSNNGEWWYKPPYRYVSRGGKEPLETLRCARVRTFDDKYEDLVDSFQETYDHMRSAEFVNICVEIPPNNKNRCLTAAGTLGDADDAITLRVVYDKDGGMIFADASGFFGDVLTYKFLGTFEVSDKPDVFDPTDNDIINFKGGGCLGGVDEKGNLTFECERAVYKFKKVKICGEMQFSNFAYSDYPTEMCGDKCWECLGNKHVLKQDAYGKNVKCEDICFLKSNCKIVSSKTAYNNPCEDNEVHVMVGYERKFSRFGNYPLYETIHQHICKKCKGSVCDQTDCPAHYNFIGSSRACQGCKRGLILINKHGYPECTADCPDHQFNNLDLTCKEIPEAKIPLWLHIDQAFCKKYKSEFGKQAFVEMQKYITTNVKDINRIFKPLNLTVSLVHMSVDCGNRGTDYSDYENMSDVYASEVGTMFDSSAETLKGASTKNWVVMVLSGVYPSGVYSNYKGRIIYMKRSFSIPGQICKPPNKRIQSIVSCFEGKGSLRKDISLILAYRLLRMIGLPGFNCRFTEIYGLMCEVFKTENVDPKSKRAYVKKLQSSEICLQNQGELSLIHSCGNGFIEPGEECDPGLETDHTCSAKCTKLKSTDKEAQIVA